MKRKKYLKLNVNIFIKSIIMVSLLLCFHLQSCVMEKSDLKITVINQSNKNLYVGSIYDCDSCQIKKDIDIHKSLAGNTPQNMIPLGAKKSIQVQEKLILSNIKMYAIVADSLDKYDREGNLKNILSFTWVKIIKGDVNMKNKSCIITIK